SAPGGAAREPVDRRDPHAAIAFGAKRRTITTVDVTQPARGRFSDPRRDFPWRNRPGSPRPTRTPDERRRPAKPIARRTHHPPSRRTGSGRSGYAGWPPETG